MGELMMHSDVISAASAKCFIILDGNRYNFMQAKNVVARIEKRKAEVSMLGRLEMVYKTIGWSGKGSATFYYNTSIFRELLYRYKNTGIDIYFDMQLFNFDPASGVGRQTIILKECNTDGCILGKFEVDGECLEEDFDFTFSGFEIPEKFKNIDGMI